MARATRSSSTSPTKQRKSAATPASSPAKTPPKVAAATPPRPRGRPPKNRPPGVPTAVAAKAVVTPGGVASSPQSKKHGHRVVKDSPTPKKEGKRSPGKRGAATETAEDSSAVASPPLAKRGPGRKSNSVVVVVDSDSISPPASPLQNGDGGKERRFLCPYCQQAFTRKYDMEKHSRKHTGDKPYQCGVCGRRFVQVGSLAVHMRAHTGEMPYKCDVCSKGFAVKERLRLHQRTHTGERPYKCEHCDKSFARGGQLMVHRRTHTGDKPYACPQCSLKFTSSGNLKTHLKLHVGAREFQCHLCDKAYPRADTLKRHILSFHENKRLYKCDVCQKSFKGHIRDHMRTHAEDKDDKPFGCTQCGARFNQRSQLTVHMRVHTGERPYSCKICARSFSHSTALKLHLRMHTGEKPHVCKLCKKAFAQLPHLKKHMLCVHNSDKPYYCERCSEFFKIKNDYQEHVEIAHPDDIPDDLVGVAVPPGSNDALGSISDIKIVEVAPAESTFVDPDDPDDTASGSGVSAGGPAASMPMEKMRTLLALLLKKISTPGRLKKLGFGTRLIDDVLRESIQASGRSPCRARAGMDEGDVLSANIQILLDWTIPEEYMAYFRSEKKTTTEILEELAA